MDWTVTGLMGEISESLKRSTADLHPETAAGVEAATEAGVTADADPDRTADHGPEAEAEEGALGHPVETGPTAEVLEGLGALAGHQRAPGGPEAEAPEQAGLEVLRSQQAEVGVDLSRDLGQHLQRREEVEKEVQAQEHQPASTERD